VKKGSLFDDYTDEEVDDRSYLVTLFVVHIKIEST